LKIAIGVIFLIALTLSAIQENPENNQGLPGDMWGDLSDF